LSAASNRFGGRGFRHDALVSRFDAEGGALLRAVRTHSKAVLAGAEALRAMLEGGAAIQPNYQIVMDREQDADDVTARC